MARADGKPQYNPDCDAHPSVTRGLVALTIGVEVYYLTYQAAKALAIDLAWAALEAEIDVPLNVAVPGPIELPMLDYDEGPPMVRIAD